jgi:hypothetical protein
MRIKRFNESLDWIEDDEIPFGYKYSWSDIFDMIVDLIDLGFEVVKNDRFFINENDEMINKNENEYRYWNGKENFYKDVKGTCYILKLDKDIKLFKFKATWIKHRVLFVNGIYGYKFHKSSDEMLKILEIINQLENRERIYHSYDFSDNKISLILMIQSDIVEGFSEKKIKELREAKIRENIQDIISKPSRLSYNNKSYTKKFREEAFGSIKRDIWIGDDNFFEESKMTILPINLNFTKQVLSSNIERLESDIKRFIDNNKERGINIEWRKITKQEAEEVDSPEIEGMMGMIYKYDINKLKKYVSDKIDKGEI